MVLHHLIVYAGRTGKGCSSTDLDNECGVTYRIVSHTQKMLKVRQRYLGDTDSLERVEQV